MKLPVKKYQHNSAMVILPKKDFEGCTEVWVYREEQLSDSERLKLLMEKVK